MGPDDWICGVLLVALEAPADAWAVLGGNMLYVVCQCLWALLLGTFDLTLST